MVRNPLAKDFLVLGLTQVQWDAAKAALTSYLTARMDQEQVDEVTLRAALPAIVTDRAWNELKNALGITSV